MAAAAEVSYDLETLKRIAKEVALLLPLLGERAGAGAVVAASGEVFDAEAIAAATVRNKLLAAEVAYLTELMKRPESTPASSAVAAAAASLPPVSAEVVGPSSPGVLERVYNAASGLASPVATVLGAAVSATYSFASSAVSIAASPLYWTVEVGARLAAAISAVMTNVDSISPSDLPLEELAVALKKNRQDNLMLQQCYAVLVNQALMELLTERAHPSESSKLRAAELKVFLAQQRDILDKGYEANNRQYMALLMRLKEFAREAGSTFPAKAEEFSALQFTSKEAVGEGALVEIRAALASVESKMTDVMAADEMNPAIKSFLEILIQAGVKARSKLLAEAAGYSIEEFLDPAILVRHGYPAESKYDTFLRIDLGNDELGADSHGKYGFTRGVGQPEISGAIKPIPAKTKMAKLGMAYGQMQSIALAAKLLENPPPVPERYSESQKEEYRLSLELNKWILSLKSLKELLVGDCSYLIVEGLRQVLEDKQRELIDQEASYWSVLIQQYQTAIASKTTGAASVAAGARAPEKEPLLEADGGGGAGGKTIATAAVTAEIDVIIRLIKELSLLGRFLENNQTSLLAGLFSEAEKFVPPSDTAAGGAGRDVSTDVSPPLLRPFAATLSAAAAVAAEDITKDT